MKLDEWSNRVAKGWVSSPLYLCGGGDGLPLVPIASDKQETDFPSKPTINQHQRGRESHREDHKKHKEEERARPISI